MKPLFPSPDREGARGLCELKPRGVAILMVIAVLAGLMALAAPFVLSMVLHGRTARGDLNALQARLGSEAATSHALAQLVKRTVGVELKIRK
jgi:Tfp pilus assembly protein FimT